MPALSVESDSAKVVVPVQESRILPPQTHKSFTLFDALDQMRKEFPIKTDNILIVPHFDITKGRYEIPCSKTCGQMHLKAA